MNAKYIQISEAIKRQIHNGDFLIEKIPSERRLAENHGVSYMTARRAVQHLLEEEVLDRSENGRLSVNRSYSGVTNKINAVLILPDWLTPDFSKYRRALANVIKERDGILKTVFFDHKNDSVIAEALNGDFNKIFILQTDLPEMIIQRLISMKEKVIVFYSDMTDLGLTCVDPISEKSIKLLIDHLIDYGHKKIALLNTQPLNDTIVKRINFFESYVKKIGLDFQIINSPVQDFERADFKARDLVRDLIKTKKLQASGLVCTTIDAAQGALRGIYDSGLTPGKDISVTCFGGKESAQISIPSITTIGLDDEIEASNKLITDVIDRETEEKLMYRFENVKLLKGESSDKYTGK